ncbi:MAG: SPOR domain-containing protein [Thermoanaerobaculia bacterium]
MKIRPESILSRAAGLALLATLATLAVTGSCAPAGRKATLPPVPPPSPAPQLPPESAPAAAAPQSAVPMPPAEPSSGDAPPVASPAAPAPPVGAPVRPLLSTPRPFTGWVRIGLATDLESITLPCCEGELSVDVGSARLDVASPLRIRPAAASVGITHYRVQIAALKDEGQAKELARRLGVLATLPADARFDAQAGIYRVRLGRFTEREAAEEAGRRLVRFGVDSSWVVSEGGALGEAALELTHRGKSYRVAGRSFALGAAEDSGVRWEGRRYRGRLVVFLNDRGRLNLVNEVPI